MKAALNIVLTFVTPVQTSFHRQYAFNATSLIRCVCVCVCGGGRGML